MTARIGLDFGTANTVVARWDETLGRGEPVPLEGADLLREGARGVRQRVVPSLLAYDATGERRWLGAQVTPELAARPGVTVFQSTKSNLTGRAADIPRPVGDRKISGREAAARFLGDVMALATLAAGADDLEIVATAPVESFDTYRDWLVREVEGGPARIRVVDEATAAAVGYSARMNPGQVFCVFDFGAGTLDVSAVRVQDPERGLAGGGPGVRVVAKAGVDLGGNHIDALLAEHAAEEAGLPHGDAVTRNRVFRLLLASAEAAKVALARRDAAAIEAADPVTGRRYAAEVTRGAFERMLRERDVLGRVTRTLRKVLDNAAAKGYPAGEMAGMFLVGGSSLIPAVRDAIALQFDPELVHLDRPLEAVAAGAAGIAGGRELHDHIQHDYVIRHIDQETGAYGFEPLVESGTPYPTPEPVRSLGIRAVRDGQRRLGLAIYELAHATHRDAADLEIVFDAAGGARAVPVTPQRTQERAMVWLNEDTPTFLEADPPAAAGADRFRLDFRVDPQKRLTVSAFDLVRRVWVLEGHPVVRLA
ncbi:Hsp70 family protein [Spirillospora sp. CA-255316]